MDATSYKHNQVETALVAAFDILPDLLPAFRGRLRHLRKHGVPDLPAVGRGGVVQYSTQDVVELVVALELEAIGIPPARTPAIITNARSHVPMQLELIRASREGDLWFVIAPDVFYGAWNRSFLCRSDVVDARVADFQKEYHRVSATDLGLRLKRTIDCIRETEPTKRGP